MSFHLNELRKVNPLRDHSSHVPDMIIHAWFKKLEKPDKSEGFESVETVEFVAGPFKSKEEEEIFYSYNF